jgi:hypothetical protein
MRRIYHAVHCCRCHLVRRCRVWLQPVIRPGRDRSRHSGSGPWNNDRFGRTERARAERSEWVGDAGQSRRQLALVSSIACCYWFGSGHCRGYWRGGGSRNRRNRACHASQVNGFVERTLTCRPFADTLPTTQIVKLNAQAVNGRVCLLGELSHLVVLRKCLLASALHQGVQVTLDRCQPVTNHSALLRREVARIHAGECSCYGQPYTMPQLGGAMQCSP